MGLTPLETHTRREDIYEAIKKMLLKRGIDLTKVVSVTRRGNCFAYLKCRPGVPDLLT